MTMVVEEEKQGNLRKEEDYKIYKNVLKTFIHIII